jgi:hypothetical protein
MQPCIRLFPHLQPRGQIDPLLIFSCNHPVRLDIGAGICPPRLMNLAELMVLTSIITVSPKRALSAILQS